MIDYQLKIELSQDINEIVNTHLLVDKESIIFRKDKTGASLREFLVNENSSALILDANQKVVRTYGFFAYDKKLVDSALSKLKKTKSTQELQIPWNKQSLKSVVIPLVNKGQIMGYLLLGKSTSYLDGLRQTMWMVFSTLGLLSLTGSFIVGYFLARRTLNPMIKLANLIENMDVDKLDKTLKPEGHPQDEIVLFINKFNEMIFQIKNMSSRQKAFIANASHELKTPLTRAISTLEVIKSTPEITQDIQLVKEDLFYLDTLLENLLFLTKLKKNDQTAAKKQNVKMGDLFLTLEKYFKNKLQEKEITLLTNFPETIQTVLPTEYLEIILSNLISNSIKYSLPKRWVSVSVKTGDRTTIEIKDKGVGMTSNETSHMFDRFYRGKNNIREHGYGIGLSIVKQICDVYKIPISVKSEKGKGTTIRLVV
jgi:signal transduction histidine kinase